MRGWGGGGPGGGVGSAQWPVSVSQAAKLAKMKIPPSEMFLSEGDKYSRFDENVRTTFPFRPGHLPVVPELSPGADLVRAAAGRGAGSSGACGPGCPG